MAKVSCCWCTQTSRDWQYWISNDPHTHVHYWARRPSHSQAVQFTDYYMKDIPVFGWSMQCTLCSVRYTPTAPHHFSVDWIWWRVLCCVCTIQARMILWWWLTLYSLSRQAMWLYGAFFFHSLDLAAGCLYLRSMPLHSVCCCTGDVTLRFFHAIYCMPCSVVRFGLDMNCVCGGCIVVDEYTHPHT